MTGTGALVLYGGFPAVIAWLLWKGVVALRYERSATLAAIYAISAFVFSAALVMIVLLVVQPQPLDMQSMPLSARGVALIVAGGVYYSLFHFDHAPSNSPFDPSSRRNVEIAKREGYGEQLLSPLRYMMFAAALGIALCFAFPEILLG